MNWLIILSAFESFARISLERVVNSLPEGLLIAAFAWLLLRVIGRQNAGTRFVVWMLALAAIAALPFVSGLGLSLSGENILLPNGVLSHLSISQVWVAPICLGWIIGASVGLARVAAGFVQVRRIRRASKRLEPTEVAAYFPEGAKEVLDEAWSKAVVLAQSDEVRVPAVMGLWKPMIVFPSWALRELSAERLNSILLHELAHVRRMDAWTNLLQKLVRAVFFFHPAVWWIDKRLSVEREMACDDAVLAKTGTPYAYASCLLELLEKTCASRGWEMAQAAVHRAHEASLRIAQILDPRRPRTTRLAKTAPVLAAAFSLACFGVLMCAPRLVVFMPAGAAFRPSLAASDYPGEAMVPKVVPASYVVRETPEVPLKPVLTSAPSATQKRMHRVNRPAAKRSAQRADVVAVRADLRPSAAQSLVFAVALTENQAAPVGNSMAEAQTTHPLDTSEPNGVILTGLASSSNRSAAAYQVWRVVVIQFVQTHSQAQGSGKSI